MEALRAQFDVGETSCYLLELDVWPRSASARVIAMKSTGLLNDDTRMFQGQVRALASAREYHRITPLNVASASSAKAPRCLCAPRAGQAQRICRQVSIIMIVSKLNTPKFQTIFEHD